ncbi:MAG: hypothetical protein H5T86_00155 [Armatimonadetes bacterium]|nr:hypothetical protein [Armatimonadota bacterium]
MSYGGPRRDFLADFEARQVPLESKDVELIGLYLGQGRGALEVVVVSAQHRPDRAGLREIWKERVGGRATPVLLVALYGDHAALCGPTGDKPEVYEDIPLRQAEGICRAALREPSRHAAIRRLRSILSYLDTELPGVRNEGFLTNHELKRRVPSRPDFAQATEKARMALGKRGEELLSALGFSPQRIDNRTFLLRTGNRRRAVAVLVLPDETPDLASGALANRSPISYALAVAEKENVEYVILLTPSSVRLHPVRDGVGVAQRGRTDTFVEIDLDLLPSDRAGYLWLLFSAEALDEGGTLEAILESARDHAAGIGERLRERIYEKVIPNLALALWRARGITTPTYEELRETYEMALVFLFRVLFIAYAEDKDLLPYRTNEQYRNRSLKTKAREVLRIHRERREISAGTDYWDEIMALCRAVDEGRREWDVPAYDGQLFSNKPDACPAGAKLEAVKLANNEFVPILYNLLIDESAVDGVIGPVDFAALGVREFGTIYEGLLENELAIAETDLTTKRVGEREVYWPVEKPTRRRAEVKVRKGEAYLHDASGARKSTGSYYTPPFVVAHLLDCALEPALERHIERLEALDDDEAGEAFFDFRVADIAMGSGHFLVAAIDRIERRLSAYLNERPLAAVTAELARLRKAAREALGSAGEGVVIEDSQLLRRQIARRCIYGVDINPLAVQLARLSIWIHTFVPGLPLSLLDHNLVVGNSVVGIGTIEEAVEELERYARHDVKRLKGREHDYKTPSLFGGWVEEMLRAARKPLERLAHLTDATTAEIQEARDALAAASEAAAPVRALFDILTAARLDENLAARLMPETEVPVIAAWRDKPEAIFSSPEWERAQEVLAGLQPFHFPAAFPEVFLRNDGRGGFDCILGNPPWEKPKVEDKSFWGRHFPGYFSMSQREREAFKRRISNQRPDLVEELNRELERADRLRDALKRNASFETGAGDPDLYIAFSWRFWQLLRQEGYFGVVLPRQVAMGSPAGPVRRTWLEQGTLTDVTFLLNREHWVFRDQHPQYTIALTSVAKRRSRHGTVALRGPYPSRERFEEGRGDEPLRFQVEDVLSWTDTAALPLLPDEEAGEVFMQLRRAPRLDLEEPGWWRARPYAELHATHDKPLMDLRSRKCPEGYWPVYKGESFDIWQPDTGTYYAWANPERVMAHLQEKRLRAARSRGSPFAEFPQQWLRDPKTLPCLRPRIAFRDVTRATDSRTVRVALVPPRVFLVHTAPFVLWPRGDGKDQAYLVGVLASIPLDWYSRRLVEGHLTYAIFNALPVPRPSRRDALWRRVVELAGRLAAVDERFEEWAAEVGVECGPLGDEEKEDMIAELDAVVAHLYGLNERQLVHIFETFHEGWDYTLRLNATLEHFRTWSKRL